MSDLTAAKPGGDTSYEWHGRRPYKGRYWACSNEKMDQFHADSQASHWKPESLLERIVESSSDPGDVVLDPFCGCGTAIAVAGKLDRRWIGIDVTYLATNLIKSRLVDAFGEEVEFSVTGEPTTADDAARLAKEDPYQFEAWTLGLVGARTTTKKKGADRGIDGRLTFHEKEGGQLVRS